MKIKRFDQFLIREYITSETNRTIAKRIWDEFTVTNKPFFDKSYAKLIEDLDGMDGGEIRDYFDNQLFCLYIKDTNFHYQDHEIGKYQRTKCFTSDEVHQKDEQGKDIWDYLGEDIQNFLVTKSLIESD